MNTRSTVMLIALAALCLAVTAWAAEAPRSVPAPASQGQHLAPVPPAGAPGGDELADAVDGDFDDLDLDASADDGGPGGPGGPGADGSRRVIVRRIELVGGRGCECGSMGGRAGRGMGGPGMGRGMGPGPGMFGRALQALDLTDAQREKLAEVRDRQQRREIQARADLEITRLDLRKAMRAEKPEAGAINAQIDKVAKLRTEMAKARVGALLEARALLTPEQQKKLREMREHRGAGGPGMGMRPGGMGGMNRGEAPMRERGERDSTNHE